MLISCGKDYFFYIIYYGISYIFVSYKLLAFRLIFGILLLTKPKQYICILRYVSLMDIVDNLIPEFVPLYYLQEPK